MIAFYVPGPPCGKQRPRVLKSGRAFTPAKTKAYEAHVRGCARADGAIGPELLAGPLQVHLHCRMPIPKSFSRKKRADAVTGALAHTSKPDADNIAKVVTDALNGVLWRDDSQIVTLVVSKRYGDEPGVWVRVETV